MKVNYSSIRKKLENHLLSFENQIQDGDVLRGTETPHFLT